MQISVFVFTVKRVYVVLMVCDDDLLIHGRVLRCDQMNIHQHKSSQVASVSVHVCISYCKTDILYVHAFLFYLSHM